MRLRRCSSMTMTDQLDRTVDEIPARSHRVKNIHGAKMRVIDSPTPSSRTNRIDSYTSRGVKSPICRLLPCIYLTSAQSQTIDSGRTRFDFGLYDGRSNNSPRRHTRGRGSDYYPIAKSSSSCLKAKHPARHTDGQLHQPLIPPTNLPSTHPTALPTLPSSIYMSSKTAPGPQSDSIPSILPCRRSSCSGARRALRAALPKRPRRSWRR